MTDSLKSSLAEIEQFARRYGLARLTKEHLERMQELAPIVAELGRDLPRPPQKSDAPAARFQVLPRDTR